MIGKADPPKPPQHASTRKLAVYRRCGSPVGSAINRQGKDTRQLDYGGVGRLSPRWVVPIRQAAVPESTPHKGGQPSPRQVGVT